MQQKGTWMRCLLIGISILIISLSGCGEGETEYRLDTEFVFVNESSRAITFTIISQREGKTKVSLAPNEKDTVLLLASGGFENPNPDSCCQGLLHGVLDQSDQGFTVVRFDNNTCMIQEPAMISNYTNEILGHRLFRYTFVFTDEVLDNPIRCL